MLWMLLACGPTPCEALCDARAACVADTIAAYDTTWPEWTGYADESAYAEACRAEFAADDEPPQDMCEAAEVCAAES